MCVGALGRSFIFSELAKTALVAIPSSASPEILEAVDAAKQEIVQLRGFVDLLAGIQASSIHLQNTSLAIQVCKLRQFCLAFFG